MNLTLRIIRRADILFNYFQDTKIKYVDIYQLE